MSTITDHIFELQLKRVSDQIEEEKAASQKAKQEEFFRNQQISKGISMAIEGLNTKFKKWVTESSKLAEFILTILSGYTPHCCSNKEIVGYGDPSQNSGPEIFEGSHLISRPIILEDRYYRFHIIHSRGSFLLCFSVLSKSVSTRQLKLDDLQKVEIVLMEEKDRAIHFNLTKVGPDFPANKDLQGELEALNDFNVFCSILIKRYYNLISQT